MKPRRCCQPPIVPRANAPIDYAALDFLLTGDMVRAAEVYPDDLIASTRASGDLIGHFSAISTVGWAHLYQGRLRKAAQLFQTGLAEVATAGLQHFFADMFYHLGLGTIYYEWNDSTRLSVHLEQGLQLAESGISVEANGALVGSMALALIRQARGDAAGALEILDRFAQLAHQRHFAAALIARVKRCAPTCCCCKARSMPSGSGWKRRG